MSELQNENTKVMVSENVDSTTPATEESKDNSLGKLGIALIGLAAIGTYTVGKEAVKGCMHVVNKIKEKKAGSKVSDDYDADFVEEDFDDELEDDFSDDEDKNEK